MTLMLGRVFQAISQVHPGVEGEKPQGRVCPGKQYGYHREVGVTPLTLQRQVFLALLPVAHSVGTEEDRNGTTGVETLFQHLGPGTPRDQVPAVQEGGNAAIL